MWILELLFSPSSVSWKKKTLGMTSELLHGRNNEASFLLLFRNIFFACPADIYIIIYLWCYGNAKLSKTLLTHVFRKMKANWITQHSKASEPEPCHFDMKGIFERKAAWKQPKCSSKWLWVGVKHPIYQPHVTLISSNHLKPFLQSSA